MKTRKNVKGYYGVLDEEGDENIEPVILVFSNEKKEYDEAKKIDSHEYVYSDFYTYEYQVGEWAEKYKNSLRHNLSQQGKKIMW